MAQINADKDINALSRGIIGCGFTVLNTLGAGFLEKVYENALAIELRSAGYVVAQQRGLTVVYRDSIVGEYFADLIVDETILVELKTVAELVEVHRAQCVNYLRASGLHLCLLLNFGKPHLEIKRVAHNL